MRVRSLTIPLSAALVALALTGASGVAGAGTRAPTALLARGGRVSGVAHPEHRGAALRPTGVQTMCSTPGGTNYMADCNTSGLPANETWIDTNQSSFVAGANDYNSYNGNADLGYYTSTDGKTWTDNGPLDLFPHDANNAAGDPGVLIDADGVVYYSGIFFSYVDCNVGGVELARRDPATGTWTYHQIQANSDDFFQDKPAIAVDPDHVYVAWTKYFSCTGIGVKSPIKVAVFRAGAESGPPIRTVSVPGSTYSQGASVAPDRHGGFYIAWEEFPSPDSTVGFIKLAHFRAGDWDQWGRISPDGFQDLPSPLPGFAFRDNSFPALTIAGGEPKVAWTSYDSGVGRAYLWSNGNVSVLSDRGGDQFFPAIAALPSGEAAVTWSQTNAAAGSYDQFLARNGRVFRVSTAPSFPNQDCIFGGTFIGDYSGMTVFGTAAMPIWTDVRTPSAACDGLRQDAMVYAP